ncbi:MAG: hypothetical protein LBJ72_06400 [Dysgonamonadaceae bacterium]|jgi:hypothetical protein|nr:hypothetical protein [Dysgonamonadaceae bacterium]
MNKISFFIIPVLFLAIFVACSPISKESYLEKYDDFITEISENSKSYDEKAWVKATGKYEKFSGEWYDKFKKELTVGEKLKITKNQAQFYYYKNLQQGVSLIKDLLKSLNIDEMRQQVQYYIDNNMQDDLEKFYEEAQKSGKDVEKVATEILKGLNVKIDELNK